MKINRVFYHPYEIPLSTGQLRKGVLINLVDDQGNSGWGDAAPLPKWSEETLDEATVQLHLRQADIMRIDWTREGCLNELENMSFYPSVLFGLESALLSMLFPLPEYIVPASALLMGSSQEIMGQAELRHRDGFTSAKLKVSQLGFKEAASIIHQLKDKFRLRIDVNRAWSTPDSLQFFKPFELGTFDYVEEPFQNPHDLHLFPHPLAVDESFPLDLSLKELESLPALKALIYKPTLQGGMSGCLPLLEWADKRGIKIVLSSSFESDLGLANVASMAYRLSLFEPLGIGTYHYLDKHLCSPPLEFFRSFASFSRGITFCKF